MRINKYLSETGIISRRGADKWIADGKVTINGELATVGSQVEDGDIVCVDGKEVKKEQQLVYIALNKPVGITSTTERHIKAMSLTLSTILCVYSILDVWIRNQRDYCY